MQVIKPIFIIGTGRCGSTIFHRIFSHHSQVAWLSWFCEKYPENPAINRWFMRAINIPILGDFLIKKATPGEAYELWEPLSRGFSKPFRDLTKDDLTSSSKANIQKVMEQMLTKKRNRLLIKITGWPRIRFLKEIFPDAKFIHVIRDPRGVTNSLMNIGFWKGWEGPQKWRWGLLDEEYQKSWEKYDKSFVILAAIEWKLLIDALEKSKGYLSESQFMEIKYEDLIYDTTKIFKEVIHFCELDWNKQFESKIKRFKLSDMNIKWKESLAEHQKKMLDDFLMDYIKKYDYE